MTGTLHTLLEMSWVELAELDKSSTIIFVPLSPIEEHGPHLPLGTDIFAARDIAERAARYICEEGDPRLHVVLAPAIPLGCSAITADFPGTLSLKGSTLYHLVEDFCTALAESGFQYIVIANHHLDPVHLKAILTAIESVSAQYDVRIIETAGRIYYSGMETEEIRQGQAMGLRMQTEVHADVRETAYIKYRYPHLIKHNTDELPEVLIDVKDGFKNGWKTFKEMGAVQGYIGSPAMASPSYGQLHLEEHARMMADMALRLVNGEPLPEMDPRMKEFLKTRISLE